MRLAIAFFFLLAVMAASFADPLIPTWGGATLRFLGVLGTGDSTMSCLGTGDTSISCLQQ